MHETELWTVTKGEGPIVATAIHAGHALRPEIAQRMRLSDAERLREEDPYTDVWTEVAGTRVVLHRSRFEVDLNRPREDAVYVNADQSWGLEVWTAPLPAAVIERSLEIRERFYAMLEGLLEEKQQRYGRFVVYDIHSYNHRRGGPGAGVADAAGNPEVNVGTGSMDRARWTSLVDGFMADLGAAGSRRLSGSPWPPGGAGLDVRENVRFRGGYLAQYVHERFRESGCALAIEFKKTFMDEWTGEADEARIARLGSALASTVPGVVRELSR